MTAWQKTYISIWISQFISIFGFAFALPFAPYYIQELGVTDPVSLRLWVSLFAAATPLALAIFSPIWGAASDKFGHRVMMLRANFSATIVLALMGLVDNVEALILLRFLQGALTGTFMASQVMVATYAPPEKSGRALGSLSAAVFSGAMCGASLGGLFSAMAGYRSVFFIGAALLLVSALIILFGTHEDRSLKHPEPHDEPAQAPSSLPTRLIWSTLPMLILIFAVSFVRQFDMAMMPLLVQEIYGSLDGVSIYTGALFAVSGIAGFVASIWLGRLADRVRPDRLCHITAITAGLAMIPHALAIHIWHLYPTRLAMMFSTGGLEAITQIWLSKIAPQKNKGLIFGWAGTARSTGWVIAPLISGAIAAAYGIRPIYFVGAALFILMIPLIIWTSRKTRAPH